MIDPFAQVVTEFELGHINYLAALRRWPQSLILTEKARWYRDGAELLRRHQAACQEVMSQVEQLLLECRSDIFQTARANQMNLDGRDLINPGDSPCVECVGRHQVHQDGIDASLRLVQKIGEMLRDLHGSKEKESPTT